VPIEVFYEWKKLGPKDKQPYAIALADHGIMALAGLWENWKSPAEEWVRSFNDRHDDRQRAERGSPRPDAGDPAGRGVADLARRGAGRRRSAKAVLAPYPPKAMTMWPVSARVGNVKNNDPELIEPL
jgi:putative SOS response-associated peptidase YedK